jgi:hypothetical protein
MCTQEASLEALSRRVISVLYSAIDELTNSSSELGLHTGAKINESIHSVNT